MALTKRDRTSIAVGAVCGAVQPVVLAIDPMFTQYSTKALVQVCIFGLVVPPVLALFNRAVPTKPRGQAMFARHVNSVLLIIAWGIATGLSGLAWYKLGAIPKSALIVIGFFGSAGVGFLVAHLLNPNLAESFGGDT